MRRGLLHFLIITAAPTFGLYNAGSLRAQSAPDTTAAGPRPACLSTPAPSCIFRMDELSEQPALLKIQPPFPFALDLKCHVKYRVQVVAIIDTTGHIEPGSTAIAATPDSALSPFALRGAQGAVYRPGRLNGRPVRVRVVIPITYTTNRACGAA